MILAIDPGPTESAYVVFEDGRVKEFGKVSTDEMLEIVHRWRHWPMAVEMIASYGMPVGAEVFETCVVIGRIWQAYGREPIRIRRIEVKMQLCNSARATDATVRQSLLDMFGGKEKAIGRKSAPGPLYGVSRDVWAALAVAVCADDGGYIGTRMQMRGLA